MCDSEMRPVYEARPARAQMGPGPRSQWICVSDVNITLGGHCAPRWASRCSVCVWRSAHHWFTVVRSHTPRPTADGRDRLTRAGPSSPLAAAALLLPPPPPPPVLPSAAAKLRRTSVQQVLTESGADRGVDSPALSHHGQMSATDAPARPKEGSAARASETSSPNAVCPVGCSGITTRTSLMLPPCVVNESRSAGF